MVTKTTVTGSRPSSHTLSSLAGIALVTGGVLTVLGFLIHPPEVADASQQTAIINDHAFAWRAAHLLLAAGALGIGLAAYSLLVRGGTLCAGPVGGTIWTAILAFGLVSMIGFFLEGSTVVTFAAQSVSAYTAVQGVTTLFLLALIPLDIAFFAFAARETVSPTPSLPRTVNVLAAVAAFVAFPALLAAFTPLGNLAPAWLGYGQYGLLAYFVFLAAVGVQALRMSRRTVQFQELTA